MTQGLNRLIHYADARSMDFEIESRMPFMDHRLIEFCLKVRSATRFMTDTPSNLHASHSTGYCQMKSPGEKKRQNELATPESRMVRRSSFNLDEANN
ncbi:MAG: asparagine synthase-related protein [Burkholderiaceae bacterium]